MPANPEAPHAISNIPQISARFVLLHHDWPESHWDFLVDLNEKSDHVATWSLDAPILDQFCCGKAQKLSDHRRMYLDYEGPVSGDRGTVERVMAGTVKVLSHREDCLELELTGDQSGTPVHQGLLIVRRLSDKINAICKTHRHGAEMDWEFQWSPGSLTH